MVGARRPAPALVTDPRLQPPPRFTTYQSPLTTNAFLIATAKLLEIKLTHSQQTRKHFLIRTIRPTFTSVPLLTHHSSLITHHRLTSFLFDTNKPHRIIILVSLPMKTKEKPHSIRYKFADRAVSLPAAEDNLACATPSALTHPQPSCYSESPDVPRHRIAIPKKLQHARQILRRNAHGDPS